MGKLHTRGVFGKPFKGPIIPFGSLVEYNPISATDQSRIHQFGKKVLPGLFLGYALYAEGFWKGDVLVADLEELETMDASEIYSKRLNAKEVIFPQDKGEFIFPIEDGRIKTLVGDQDLRTSTLVRHRPIQGESHLDFLGEPEGSLPQPQDSCPDAGVAIYDFWSMSGNFIYRHHVEPRVKLYSPREESFPIPLKYIDVTRTSHTNLDVKQEKRIDDYWNIDGSRDLSDPWTGFTRKIGSCVRHQILNLRKEKFVVDSGASMHMISKKDLSDAEMDTLTKSCSPTIVKTANGELQTHEEATMYVKELDIFLTMKVLDETPAVLSLGKLCDEHGYSYEMRSMVKKPHLIKNGIRIQCNTENFVPIVVPCFVTEFFLQRSLFNNHDTFKTGN